MPGSSLWLLPPSDSPLNATLQTLIDQTSAHFDSPHRFIPHVTLTSDISPSVYGSSPQQWLGTLDLPSQPKICVVFEGLATEDVFFRKLYIRCEKADGISGLTAVCRRRVDGYDTAEEADQWAAREYNPHLSLL